MHHVLGRVHVHRQRVLGGEQWESSLSSSRAWSQGLTPGLGEGRAPVRRSLFSFFPLQVSHVSHTRLCQFKPILLVGDKDLRRFRLDIKPCQNDWSSPFAMPPHPMSQRQQRRLAKWGYILWAGPRRRDRGCFAGSYLRTTCSLRAQMLEKTCWKGEEENAPWELGSLNRI
jgi:hypothetical protein